MTDPAPITQPPATPLPADPAAGGGKSPLDMLEQILKDQKQEGAEAPATPVAAPVVPAEPLISPEELQAQQAAHKAQDEVDLKAKIAELETIKQTPEYQARVEQNAQAQTQAEEAHSGQEGFEIRQLDHTKVPETQPEVPTVPVAPAEQPQESPPVTPV